MRVFGVAVGQRDDGEVGRLAGAEAAGGGLGAERPGAKEGGHRQEQRAVKRGVAAVQEADLVEHAERGAGGAAVGPEADDDPALHGASYRGVPIGGPASVAASWIAGQRAETVFLALPLEAHRRKDSHNSSKPPSSDGPSRKLRSQRHRSEKQTGGQPGHVGHTLMQVSNPDEVVRHRPIVCAHCQQPLEGVTGQIKQQPNTIGYVELAYATQNKLPVALIKNAAGNFVEPTIDAVTAAAAASAANTPDDLRVSITNASGANAYPISSYTYILVYKDLTDATKGKAVVDFLWWGIHDGESFAKDLQYAPLPAEIVKRAEAKINSITSGGKPLR